MATVVTNIASFEVDSTKAVQQTNNLISSLNKLQSERATLVSQGKSVAAIDKQIAQETQKLNSLLNQQVSTTQAVNAQSKAYTATVSKLNQETTKSLSSQTKFNKNLTTTTKQLKDTRGGLRRSVRGLRDFRTILSFGLGGFAAQLFDVEAGFKALQNVIDPTIQLQNSLNDSVAESSIEIAKEQIELESLISVANDDNRSKKERKAAIDRINEGYGEYLPNLLTEKDLNSDLLAIQDQVNKEIIQAASNRIKLALIEERVTQALKDQINARQIGQRLDEASSFNLFAQTIRGIESLADVDVVETGITQINNQLEETIKFIEESDISGFLTSTVNLTKDAAGDAIRATQNTVGGVEKSVRNSNSNTRQQIKVLEGSLGDLQKRLGEINKVIREQTVATDTQALAPLISQAQELQKQIDEAKKLRDELENPPQQERQTFLTNEIEALDVVRLRREESLLALRRENEQLEINNITQQRILQNSLNERLRNENLTAEERTGLNQQIEEERQRIDNETTAQLIKNKLQILEISKQIAEEDGEGVDDLIKQIEKLKLELAELNGETVNVEVKADTKQPISQVEKLRNTILTIADGVGQLGGEITNFLSAQVQNQVSILDQAISKQKGALDSLLSNTETANAAQVQAERDRLDKLQAQRERATDREATIAKVQIALNAAVAVARAAAEGGGFASAITIAATLTSLALGLTLANQQAQQAFYDGTLHVTRAKGEKKGRDTVNARLNEGEAVIPTATNQAYNKSVEAIFNKKVPSKILNSFVEGYQKGDLSPLTTLTPSLLPTPIPLGYNAGLKGMMDLEGLKVEVKGLRRDNKELISFLGGLPRESHVFNEKGYRKYVSQKQENQNRTIKRFS